jgi:hypothetical protein
MSAVPSGLVGLCMAKPNVETLGYYRASLRDGHEILVTLDGSSPGFLNLRVQTGDEPSPPPILSRPCPKPVALFAA